MKNYHNSNVKTITKQFSKSRKATLINQHCLSEKKEKTKFYIAPNSLKEASEAAFIFAGGFNVNAIL